MRVLIAAASLALAIVSCAGGVQTSDTRRDVINANDHTFQTIDLSGGATSSGVPNGIEHRQPQQADASYPGTVIELNPARMAVVDGTITLAVGLPAGYHVNETAPSSVVWSATGGVAAFPAGDTQSLTGASLPLDIPVSFAQGAGTITADVTLLYCRQNGDELCFINRFRFIQGITAGSGNRTRLSFRYEVTAPAA